MNNSQKADETMTQDSLDTALSFARLLRADGAKFTFGRDSTWGDLILKPDARKALKLAWFAVFGEELSDNVLEWMFTAVEGVNFYKHNR